MDNIKEKAKKLGEEVYQSDLYQSYLYYKERVENKPALKQQIDELKRLQLSQGLRRRQGEFVSLKEEEDLSKAYSDVALDPDGMGFWESEKQLMSFMAEVLEIVVAQAPIDFSYTDDMEN